MAPNFPDLVEFMTLYEYTAVQSCFLVFMVVELSLYLVVALNARSLCALVVWTTLHAISTKQNTRYSGLAKYCRALGEFLIVGDT